MVLLRDEDDPQLRWRFTDITADSFTWIAETSHDGALRGTSTSRCWPPELTLNDTGQLAFKAPLTLGAPAAAVEDVHIDRGDV
jgi:hypothetical protein